MIKTSGMLTEELKSYVNPSAKIRRLVAKKELTPIIRGLYETDVNTPGYYLAPIIYGPSYLSFEFALAYHSLIPEAVLSYTSATFEKKKSKQYRTAFGLFSYRDVPSEAYPHGIKLLSQNGYGYQIASAEKAICDQLYKTAPLNNRNELTRLLFEDLRIDLDDFLSLNMEELIALASYYHTQNHKLLLAYVRRISNGSNT
jgi:predicted transcriptional regulator of viral defense system